MKCKDARSAVELARDETLDGATRSSLELHARACARCGEVLRRERILGDALAAARRAARAASDPDISLVAGVRARLSAARAPGGWWGSPGARMLVPACATAVVVAVGLTVILSGRLSQRTSPRLLARAQDDPLLSRDERWGGRFGGVAPAVLWSDARAEIVAPRPEDVVPGPEDVDARPADGHRGSPGAARAQAVSTDAVLVEWNL